MSLQTKISFISQSRDGRTVTVVDNTGLESDGVETGYGPVNGYPVEDILAYHLFFSRFNSEKVYGFKLDDSDPLLPTIEDVSNGTPVEVSTNILSGGGVTDPAKIFYDGVLDINMYVEFAGLTGVDIVKGNNFISGADFTPFLEAESIIVNDVIYHIDKSMDDQGGTLLFIIGEFEEDSDSFNILFRANTKGLLLRMSEMYHDYACKVLINQTESSEWTKVNTAASFRRAAEGFFNMDVPDYSEANDLAISSFKLLKKYTIC